VTRPDAASPVEPGDYRPRSLRGGCIGAIAESDIDRKTVIVRIVARRWFDRTISVMSPMDGTPPDGPGRPARPELSGGAAKAVPKTFVNPNGV
jgi:uncharacterized ferritin-like protein (DUF455 family)